MDFNSQFTVVTVLCVSFNAEPSTAERKASFFAMKQLMSSALIRVFPR